MGFFSKFWPFKKTKPVSVVPPVITRESFSSRVPIQKDPIGRGNRVVPERSILDYEADYQADLARHNALVAASADLQTVRNIDDVLFAFEQAAISEDTAVPSFQFGGGDSNGGGASNRWESNDTPQDTPEPERDREEPSYESNSDSGSNDSDTGSYDSSDSTSSDSGSGE